MALTGMFGQINQAIQNSPSGQGMLDNASFHLGQAGAAITNDNDPYAWQTETGRLKLGKEQLMGVDMSTSAGLSQAAEIYGKMGHHEGQVTMAQAAHERRLHEEQVAKEQKLRESLVQKAYSMGMTDYANQIATGGTDLEADAKLLRERELEDILVTRGMQGRKALAKRAGIQGEEFTRLGLDKMTDEQFKNWFEGNKGEIKAFQDASGKNVMLATHGNLVRDPASGQWVPPSTLGLKPAVHMQRVMNLADHMTKTVTDNLFENFNEMHGLANEAVDIINNVNRNLPLIEEMPTGIFADVEMLVRRVASYYNDDPDLAVENAQTYIADAGMRTAKAITNFGSGTGLSDKDREYAEQMAAGSIKIDAGALKRILEIQKNQAMATLKLFGEVRDSVKSAMPTNGHLIDGFHLKKVNPMPAAPEKPAVRPKGRTYNPSTGRFE